MKGARKKIIFSITTLGIGLLLLSFPVSTLHKSYYLNLSPSIPRGIYRVAPLGVINIGDLVIFDPPELAHSFIYGRHWLPDGWPLLKYVGALEGDTYCVQGISFFINRRYIGKASDVDSQCLALYPVTGCHIVGRNAFLPVSTHITNSFDGRYLGTVPLSAIKGKAHAVWTF